MGMGRGGCGYEQGRRWVCVREEVLSGLRK